MSNARFLFLFLSFSLFFGIPEIFSILNEDELKIALDVAEKLNIYYWIFLQNETNGNIVFHIFKTASSKNIFSASLSHLSAEKMQDFIHENEPYFNDIWLSSVDTFYVKSYAAMIILKETNSTTRSIWHLLDEDLEPVRRKRVRVEHPPEV